MIVSSSLLIAPKGIEISEKHFYFDGINYLLIAPKGIEIYKVPTNNFLIKLLIAPKGIEMSIFE